MNSVRALKRDIASIKEKHYEDRGRLKKIQEELATELETEASCTARNSLLEEELQVILKAGARQIQNAANSLSESASYSIRKIMPQEYKGLNIEIDPSGRSITAQFELLKEQDGVVYSADPFEDNGGGVCDILSVSIKLSSLIGFTPAVEGPLIADEPSKHLSSGYRDALSETFRDLSHVSGRQVIMATHDETLTLHSDNLITLS